MLTVLGVEIAIILVLILANGFFAASELAMVSARRGRLELLAASGETRAQRALQLAENPDHFLVTVQVGISFIGTFAAAFGGARIGDILTLWFASFPVLAPYADSIALGIVVVLITYLSLVLGELVPKRLALQHAERIATVAAPILSTLATLTRPIVTLLSFSVNLVLRLIRQHALPEQTVTQEDIEYMLSEGAHSGAVEAGEAQFIKRVFAFTDRPVRMVMTPRTEMSALEASTPWLELVRSVVSSEYSRTPIYQHSLDHIIGVLYSKDVLRVLAGAAEADLMQVLRPPTFVLEGQPIDDVLTLLRRQGTHLALVLDEYGQVAGLVTIEDLLEELVGDIKDEYDQGDEPPFVKRADGSWLIDGLETYEKVRDRLSLPDELEPPRRNYTTLAGFIVSHLGRMPGVGDTIALEGYRFEVVDMDGHRIDKVLVRIPPVEASQAAAE